MMAPWNLTSHIPCDMRPQSHGLLIPGGPKNSEPICTNHKNSYSKNFIKGESTGDPCPYICFVETMENHGFQKSQQKKYVTIHGPLIHPGLTLLSLCPETQTLNIHIEMWNGSNGSKTFSVEDALQSDQLPKVSISI